MTRPPFTLDGYRATVRGLLDHGYALRSFQDAEPDQRHLVLRHDIDQSIQLARRLADVEADQGWRSTYFVLMRTEMYNPWSRAATADLRAMLALGHAVGLHLDASLYADEAALEAGAAAECAGLETIIDGPVTTVSFHRPSPEAIGSRVRIAGRLNTYGKRFFQDMGYCSDSRGEWRFGHPWDHPVVAEGRALQLLTHAVWWGADGPASPRERLEAVVAEGQARLDRELAANCAAWSGH